MSTVTLTDEVVDKLTEVDVQYRERRIPLPGPRWSVPHGRNKRRGAMKGLHRRKNRRWSW